MTHGNIFREKVLSINGKTHGGYITFDEFYDLFDVCYEFNTEITHKCISDITFIMSSCYNSILKNYFMDKISNNISNNKLDLNKTKYINFHWFTYYPINENLFVLGCYLFYCANKDINIDSYNDLLANKKLIVDNLEEKFKYNNIKANNLVDNFMADHNQMSLDDINSFKILYNHAQKNKTNNLYDPNSCATYFFDILMATGFNVKRFYTKHKIAGSSFELLKNMSTKLSDINSNFTNWIKNIKDNSGNNLFDDPNIIINDFLTDNQLLPELANLNAIFDHSCYQQGIITNSNVIIYLNKLFKAKFNLMEYYSFLNFDRKKDNNLTLRHIF